MTRILVDPEQLQSLASRFAEVSNSLQTLGRRSARGLDDLDWSSYALQGAFERMQEAGRFAEMVAAGAAAHEQELRDTAARFLEANAWRPTRSGSTALPNPVTSGGGGSASPAPTGPGMVDQLAPVYAHFPNPQMQAIMAHVMAKEGMSAPNAAHGAVVYRGPNGLVCDRQWLNFGYISFAMPGGVGDEVLAQVLAVPGEEEALREIALRHLKDVSGGTVPSSHQQFVPSTGAAIPALSAEAQIDQFIALVKSGDGKSLGEWFFKYGDEPAFQSEVATGHLRPEWGAVMTEFLARPASVDAQLGSIQDGFVEPAIHSAERFGLHSVKAVAWFVDQHVQSGSPSRDMLAMLQSTPPSAGTPNYDAWQRFHAGDEPERLQVLTELAARAGGTVGDRRRAVLANPNLTWDPFTGTM